MLSAGASHSLHLLVRVLHSVLNDRSRLATRSPTKSLRASWCSFDIPGIKWVKGLESFRTAEPRRSLTCAQWAFTFTKAMRFNQAAILETQISLDLIWSRAETLPLLLWLAHYSISTSVMKTQVLWRKNTEPVAGKRWQILVTSHGKRCPLLCRLRFTGW